MLKKFRIILLSMIILLPLMKSSIPTPYIYGTNKDFQKYSKLVVHMIKRFISPRTNTLILIEKCDITCKGDRKYHTSHVGNYVKHLSDTLAVQLFVGKHGDRPWDYNLFIVDSYSAFEALRYSFPFTQQERSFYFYVLLTWSYDDQAKYHRTMYRIFKLCLDFNVRNVVIMSKSALNDTIHFFTYQLFGDDNCFERITIEEINRFENDKLRNQFLFPDHISNFYGCSINVSAHLVEPLLTFDGDVDNQAHLKQMHRLDGIEGTILRLLADVLNFKFRLRFPKEFNIIRNYSNSTGCFGDLEQNRAQLAIGALSCTVQPNSEKFTSSATYHTTSYVFVVRTDLCFGPIKQLLNPLSTRTWILIIITFAASIIIVKMVEYYRSPEMRNFVFGSKNKHPLRYMCVIFLGNPIPTRIIAKRNFARFLLMSWFLLSFEIRNGYQGKMFDSLRFSKRIPVPHKISELIDMDYKFFTPMYSDYYPWNKTYIMRNVTARFELLQGTEMRVTTTALLDFLGQYNYKNYFSKLTYVDETIFLYPVVMYFRKHSILRASIDRKLNVLHDAGITAHIAKQHTHLYFPNMKSQYQFKLSLVNLAGLFYINMTMKIIAMFVFILEILSRKSRILRKIMDWLNSM